jgi:hypothetical protein
MDGALLSEDQTMSIMKTVLASAAAVTLTACGLTDSDKTNIAKATCSTIAETRNMDGAMRLQLVNEARSDLGEELYTDDDEKLVVMYQRGHCTDLILNNEEYVSANLAYLIDRLAQLAEEEEANKKRAKLRSEREEREKEERLRLAHPDMRKAFKEAERSKEARYANETREIYGPCPSKSDITSMAVKALKNGEMRHYGFLAECSKNS